MCGEAARPDGTPGGPREGSWTSEPLSTAGSLHPVHKAGLPGAGGGPAGKTLSLSCLKDQKGEARRKHAPRTGGVPTREGAREGAADSLATSLTERVQNRHEAAQLSSGPELARSGHPGNPSKQRKRPQLNPPNVHDATEDHQTHEDPTGGSSFSREGRKLRKPSPR